MPVDFFLKIRESTKYTCTVLNKQWFKDKQINYSYVRCNYWSGIYKTVSFTLKRQKMYRLCLITLKLFQTPQKLSMQTL